MNKNGIFWSMATLLATLSASCNSRLSITGGKSQKANAGTTQSPGPEASSDPKPLPTTSPGPSASEEPSPSPSPSPSPLAPLPGTFNFDFPAVIIAGQQIPSHTHNLPERAGMVFSTTSEMPSGVNLDPMTGKFLGTPTIGFVGTVRVHAKLDTETATSDVLFDIQSAFTDDLTLVETFKNGVNGLSNFDAPRSITFKNDGSQIYVASAFSASVSVFSRSMDGTLVLSQQLVDGAGGVDGLSNVWYCDTNSSHLFCGGYLDHAVAVVDNSNTSLAFQGVVKNGVNGVTNLLQPQYLGASPDGKFLYVGSIGSHSISVMDTSGGTPTVVSQVTNGVDGADFLTSPKGILVTNDRVYVAASTAHSISIFQRNGQTGALTFLSRVVQGVDGVDGLNGAHALVMSPDGKHLYAAGYGGGATKMGHFDVTGSGLAFRGTFGGDGTLPDMEGIAKLSMSPEGRSIYAASAVLNKIFVIDRHPASGLLTLKSSHADGDPGFELLAGTNHAAVSPDGKHVYVTASNDDAVSVYRRGSR